MKEGSREIDFQSIILPRNLVSPPLYARHDRILYSFRQQFKLTLRGQIKRGDGAHSLVSLCQTVTCGLEKIQQQKKMYGSQELNKESVKLKLNKRMYRRTGTEESSRRDKRKRELSQKSNHSSGKNHCVDTKKSGVRNIPDQMYCMVTRIDL